MIDGHSLILEGFREGRFCSPPKWPGHNTTNSSTDSRPRSSAAHAGCRAGGFAEAVERAGPQEGCLPRAENQAAGAAAGRSTREHRASGACVKGPSGQTHACERSPGGRRRSGCRGGGPQWGWTPGCGCPWRAESWTEGQALLLLGLGEGEGSGDTEDRLAELGISRTD